METKVCNTCGEEKNLSEFYKAGKAYYKYCKLCYKAKRADRELNGTFKSRLKPGTKKCGCCKEVKLHEAFYKKTTSADGLNNRCIKCSTKDNLKANDTAIRRHNRSMSSAKSLYNIDEEDLQKILHEQQGCCAICEVDFGRELTTHDGRQYHIDHSHDTGKVRGLLCRACNTYVGHMEAFKAGPKVVLEYIARGY